MMLGQSDTLLSNYEHRISFWHMVPNPILTSKENEQRRPGKQGKQRHWNEFEFDDDYSSRHCNSFEPQINPDDMLVENSMSESEASEEDAKYLKIPAFNEARIMRLFLRKMKERY